MIAGCFLVSNLNASPQSNSDIEKILSKYAGVYTSPPTTVNEKDPYVKNYRVPDGPLLGNGDLAVALGAETYSDISFYLSKSDAAQTTRGIGYLTFTFNRASGDKVNYKLTQDMYKAQVNSVIPLADTTVEMRSWTSDDDNLLITDIWTKDGDPVDITLKQVSYSEIAEAKAGIKKGFMWTSRKRGGSYGCIATKILDTMSAMEKDSDNSVVAKFKLPANKVVRIVTAASDARFNSNPVADALGKLMKYSGKNIDKQYENHLGWWREYWSKSHIEINDTLIERYYYGALYEMGCATRSGGVAPGLGGPWFVEGSIVWGNRYTLNYNFESPWWGVYSSNRPELAAPFYDVISQLIPPAKELAIENGTKGILFATNATPWGTFVDKRTLNMKSNASLATLNFIMHYGYTQDEDFLVDKLWPLLEELIVFWEDNIKWDEANSRWTIPGSAAREQNEAMNPINDLGYVRRIFQFLLDNSDTLEGKEFNGKTIHITQPQRQKWQSYIDNMSDYPTMIFKGKEVFKEAESVNRMTINGPGDNASVLMGVFPTEVISLNTPHLRQIAKNTVEALNSVPGKESWFQCNNVPMLYTMAVRCGYPAEEVMKNFKLLLAGTPTWFDRGDKGAYLRNNQTFNAPYHGYETVGAVEAINSMLLQSVDNVIRVFPVWVEGKDASFNCLRAYGAFLVSSEYKDGNVSYIEILSEAGKRCNIKNPWNDANIKISKVEGEQKTTVNFEIENGTICFDTEKGAQYRLDGSN